MNTINSRDPLTRLLTLWLQNALGMLDESALDHLLDETIRAVRPRGVDGSGARSNPQAAPGRCRT